MSVRWTTARTWLRRLVIAVVVLEAIYLIAGNAFLRSDWGTRVINRRPEKLAVSWSSAVTWLPGWVHFSELSLEGSGRRASWRGSAESGHAWIWLPSLVNRHFRVIRGEATGVEVDVDLLPRPDAPPGERRGWRTTLAGTRIDELRRIRVDRYEVAGSGTVSGWMRFQVRGPFEARLGRLAFDDAVVRSGGDEVARRLTLEASVETPPYRIGAQDVGELLGGLSGSLELHAEAESLGFLAAYLGKPRWLRLGGSGDLAIDVAVREGSVLPGSTLALDGPEVEADFFDLRARGEGRVDGSVSSEGSGGIRFGATLERFSVVRISDGALLLAGHDLETRVSTPSTALDERPESLAGSLRLPPAHAEDLSAFGVYLPPGLNLTIDGGSADLSADLSFDTAAGGSGSGRLQLEAQGLTGSFGDARFSTALSLDAEMPSLDLLEGRFDVSGSKLDARSTRLQRLGEVRASDWWARVRVPSGTVSLEPVGGETEGTAAGGSGTAPGRPRLASIVARVEAEMLDTAPVVVLMEQRLPRLSWFDRLLTIPDVELTGSVAFRGRELGLHGIEVVGGTKDQLEILTDLDLDGPATSGVAYVRYRALDASLALSRGDRRWSLVQARRHYDEAAAEYAASRGGR